MPDSRSLLLGLGAATALAAAAVLSGCAPARLGASPSAASPAAPRLVDPAATPETRALYANLLRLQNSGDILFGQQDATAYGVGWRPAPGEAAASVEARSDFRAVAGDFPAVYGWNAAFVGTRAFGIDSVDFALQRDLAVRAYRRGGVNTYAWHTNHPAGTSVSDTTHTVAEALPGGPFHEAFKAQLDQVAAYFDQHRDGATQVPIIFRPFHEHTGSWFWWGKAHSTPEEFVALWRFTVEYLRDEKDLHHLLYAYSPDLFNTREEYFERYPGDAYVDILGFDDYYDFWGDGRSADQFTAQMRLLGQFADERGKVAALTEFGTEFGKIPPATVATWWTDVFLPALRADAGSSRIAYMVTWRNRDAEHFFASYPASPTAPSFRAFVDAPGVLTAREAPPMYRLP